MVKEIPPGTQPAPLPEDTWTLEADDFGKIRELGRVLNKAIMDFAERGNSLHVKTVAGACEYVMLLIKARKQIIGDEVKLSLEVFKERPSLAGLITEPFQDRPKPEAPAAPTPDAATGPTGPVAAETPAPTDNAPTETGPTGPAAA